MSERILSAKPSNERLSERRRRRRRRGIAIFIILLLLLLAVAVYGIQQDSVRISHIETNSPDARITEIARQEMLGNYFNIIPRDSIFFFPEERIRADLLSTYPKIAAVSISRNSFSSISIKADERVPIARWCGDETRLNLEDSDLRFNLVSSDCYVFDAKGFIFDASASTTRVINNFLLYAPLVGGTLEPLRATVAQAEKLPPVFDFARKLGTLGSPVSSIIIRNDEVDEYLASGTRVTYLLGKEEESYTALVSAKADLNLSDGSLEYVDLRFNGKVYVKRKGDPQAGRP